MRYTTRAVLGALLAVVMGSNGFAEEAKAPWWRFGMSQDTPSAPDGVTPAPTLSPASPVATPVEEESQFRWPSLSKMNWFGSASENKTPATDPFSTSAPVAAETQPRQPSTYFGKPILRTRPRNTWAQQPASTSSAAPSASPWQAVTEGTRTAWHKTVDFVTPGKRSEAPVGAGDTHPSWWQRMWGPKEKNEGPQTVTEWMAQDRLDP
jgi:hypothetical protein